MIHYRSGYKYKLACYAAVDPIPVPDFEHDYFKVKSGTLIAYKGYAWDGPSGPTIDTKSFMRGSLVHDALYQAMREGLLDRSYREKADQILYDLCRADGMSRFRAWYVYRFVRMFGAKNVLPSASRPVLTAP